jgi:hypothetical protein
MHLFSWERQGCAVVTFASSQVARDCASALQGEMFHLRQLSTRVLLPAACIVPPLPPPPPVIPCPVHLKPFFLSQSASALASQEDIIGVTHQEEEVAKETFNKFMVASNEDAVINEEMAAELEDVDAFLNSLL